ncbi:hypothetical protein HanRHA438_Chr10g0475431 [Helianthus annuus]|nr:hypothetical protein HanIR_Chr10g0498811 [Helianthus annuus]KAJ0881545.1 hypothetical protein HanRHA438_Chr10g0475431 [Helianthus annuus]
MEDHPGPSSTGDEPPSTPPPSVTVFDVELRTFKTIQAGGPPLFVILIYRSETRNTSAMRAD